MTGVAGQESALRVLVVEDNVAHARFIRSVLESMERAVQVHPAGRVSSACDRLRNEPFDVVLTDLHLPDAQGAAVVLRLLEVAPSVPVLVISALDDPTMAQLAMAAGAHDYLTKDRLTAELLSHTLVRAGQRAAARNPAAGGALLDPATGVFSQHGIELAAAKAIAFARRHRHPVTVVHLDVRATEAEVAELTRLVAATVRDADLVGRLGQHRIVVVLPDDRSDPPALLGRLAGRLADSPLADVEVANEVRRFDPDDPVPPGELLRIASAPAAASERQRRVLVVADDPGLAAAVGGALGPSWIVFPASGVGPAMRLAALEEPHLAIVDLELADGASPAVVRGIAEQGEVAGIPIIGVVSGTRDPLLTGRGAGVMATIERPRLAADLGYQAERALR